jgi:hypothetical protein
MKQILSVIAILLLVGGIYSIVAQAEAATQYYIIFVINFYDKDIFKCIDELYVRGSDGQADARGEHPYLVAKATIEHPSKDQYKIKLPFNPRNLLQHSGEIRTYLLLEQEEQVVYKDYKHPYTPFDPKRTQYTFTFNVRTDLGCGEIQQQSLKSNSIQSDEPQKHLRVLKVPRGDQNNQ